MKKIFAILFLLLSINIYSADFWIDLKTFEYGDNDATNMIYQFAIYNYSTFSVKVSDLAVQGYVYDVEGYTASQYAYDSYGSQGSIYDNGNNWIATTTGTWQVTFTDVTYGDCGTYDGVERKYNIKFVAKYTGTEEIPANGGYMRLGSNTNYWFRIRHNDWTEFSKMDDYSSTQSYSLSSDYLNPSQYKFLQIWDYRNTPVMLCEVINTSGDIDTESGEEPCGTSACTVPTDTPTETPTDTEQFTSTFTPTFTNTPTFTPTNTPTEVVYTLHNNLGETYEDGYIPAGWDDDVIAVYDFEGNANDELGNYNGVSYTAGEIFWTDRSISGSYSFNNKGSCSYIELPDSLWQYLASLNQWTIEFWVYNNVSSNQAAIIGGNYYSNSQTQDRWWQGMVANTPAWGVKQYVFDYYYLNGIWEIIPDAPNDGYQHWVFYSMQYDGINNKMQIYTNGTLMFDINLGVLTGGNSTNVFANFVYGQDKFFIGRLTNGTSCSSTYWRPQDAYVDKLIISKTLRNGQETNYFYGSKVIENTGDVIDKIRPIHNIYNK